MPLVMMYVAVIIKTKISLIAAKLPFLGTPASSN
jgi:hypothetical protein